MGFRKLKYAVFWDVTPYVSCNNRRFGGVYHLLIMATICDLGTRLAVTSNQTRCEELLRESRVLRLVLVVIANIVPRSPILVTLIMVICSTETSVLIRATWRNTPAKNILHSHRREILTFTKILRWSDREDFWIMKQTLEWDAYKIIVEDFQKKVLPGIPWDG
jgi:hypothetical protein